MRRVRTLGATLVVAILASFGCTSESMPAQLDVTFLYPSDALRQQSAASHAWVILAEEGVDPCPALLDGSADVFDVTFTVVADVAATSPDLDTATAAVPRDESVVVYAEAADFRGAPLLAGCAATELTEETNAISVELRPVGIVDCGAAGSEDGDMCDDGDECTVDDRCGGGTCVGGRPRDCSSVGGTCTVGSCVTGMGCVPEPAPDSTPCDDGLTCSTGDFCRAGACTGGNRSACCPGPDCIEWDCSNGLDEDDDFLVDCDDFDCDGDPACAVPEICDNSVDDDGDALVDCDDPDCATDPACAPCMDSCPDANIGSVTGPAVFTGDTSTSCDQRTPACATGSAPDLTVTWQAPTAGTFRFDTAGSAFDTVLSVRAGCAGIELACDDNGGAGGTSRLEMMLSASQTVVIQLDGSSGASGNVRLNITEVIGTEAGLCNDGFDNDMDGATDCMDSDCVGDPACGEVCDDGIDNDMDGRLDCMDLDCSASSACGEIELCRNGVDDDSDGDRDCLDSECLSCAAGCPGGPSFCWDQDLGTATGAMGTTVGRCSRFVASCDPATRFGGDMAFNFIATAAGPHTFSAPTFSPTGTPVVSVREMSASCDGATLGCGPGSTTVTLASMQEVLVIVDGAGEVEGDFTLTVTSP